jgi:hypothetical protein
MSSSSGKRSQLSTDITPQNNASKNVEGVLDFNQLQYECYPDLSVVVDRTFKKSFFQKSSMDPTTTGYCIWNSGSDYINTKTSVLSLTLKIVMASDSGAQAVRWGRFDSGINCIKRLRIRDRAGNELVNKHDVNIIAAIERATMKSENWHNTVGTLSTIDANAYAIATVAGTHYVNVQIPLSELTGFFDFDQLMPAQIASGLRMEIEWEQLDKVFMFDVEPTLLNAVTYSIEDAHVVLDSCKLTDSVARSLNTRSATDGLEISYRTWFSSTYQVPDGTQSVTLETRRAVSRAFKAYCHPKTTPTNEWSIQSMSTNTENTCEEYQWRAGNLYFPQQTVRNNASAGLDNIVEKSMFLYTLSMNSKTETPLDNGRLTLRDWTAPSGVGVALDENSNGPPADNGIGNFGTWPKDLPGGMAIIPLSLERSSVQDVSGIPLNNSRVLSLSAKFGDGDAREVKIFMQYLKVARVFMDNTELEE